MRPHPARGPRRQPHAPLVNASAPDSARGGIITPATTHVSVSSTSSERTLPPRHANVTTGESLTAGFIFFFFGYLPMSVVSARRSSPRPKSRTNSPVRRRGDVRRKGGGSRAGQTNVTSPRLPPPLPRVGNAHATPCNDYAYEINGNIFG